MKLKDVPYSPAYVVFHDAYMNGAMDVWPSTSLIDAQVIAQRKQKRLEDEGVEECGGYAAYTQLPRKRVWQYHTQPAK